MKQLRFVLAVLLSTWTLSALTQNLTEQKIAGKWRGVTMNSDGKDVDVSDEKMFDIRLELRNDGTYTSTMGLFGGEPMVLKGTYTVKDNKLLLIEEGNKQIHSHRISMPTENTLMMMDLATSKELSVVYKRI